ncbi:MAG: ATP-grasp domain-containing protein [Paracoccaceae bacterium]
MHWLLQEFEDTHKLAEALDRLGSSYSWHKVVPFVGDLVPEPALDSHDAVILFGSYTLWRHAKAKRLRPGVFKLAPFVHQKIWQPYLLNGADALFLELREIPERLPDNGKRWFLRPVDDSKEEPGRVRSTAEIVQLAHQVLALDEAELPKGSLRHDTQLMLTEPAQIWKEWRLWAVNGQIVTYSLYKEGSRVVYRHEIDDDALAFGQKMVDLNPAYSDAFVLDICRTGDGLRFLETNCINAAGFYAADLMQLVQAFEALAENLR